MTPERWREITDLFHTSLAQPPAERPRFLRESCAGDQALHAEVSEMLAAHEKSGADTDVPVMALPDATLDLQPGRTIGPYVIDRLIGAGGMGRVFRARDSRLERDVAIKILPSDYADAERFERFAQEARLPGALTHPNLLTVFDVGTVDGQPFLVTEFVDGETLRERLGRGALSPTRAREVAAAIAHGLAAAHAKGVVHRDLKPENVMITRDGRVKILDFGIATLIASKPSGSRTGARDVHTEPGVIAGTAGYMAPEQIEGLETDGRADLFALGAILFEMLTGQHAFARDSRLDTLHATLHDDPLISESAGQWPHATARVVQRCLEKDPEARFQSAADLAFALETIPVTGVVPPADNRSDSRRITRAALAVAMLAALVAAGLAWRSGVSSQSPHLEAMARFTLPMAPHMRFALTPAISPDGTTIVYAANEGPVVETQRLFVRRLDQTTPIELPGTLGASSPFFSPDGDWVAFWADNKLKRTRLDATGLPIIVCSAESFLGGAWMTNGTIVFGSQGNGLRRVAAEGGAPQTLVAIDPAQSDLDHHAPEPLPGEGAVLVTVHEGDRRFRIDAVVLATGQRRTIVPAGFDATYIATGHLVYGAGAALFAVPFDPDRLEVMGPSVQLLDSVGLDRRQGVGHYALSQQGTLVFLPHVAPAQRTIAWVDRAGGVSPLPVEPRMFWTPRLSPDGRQFAVVVQEDAGRQIWIYQFESGVFTRLTTEGSNWAPVWARDGMSIAYTSEHDGRWRLMRQAVTRLAAPVLLLSSERDEVSPGAFSADGRALVYAVRSPTATGELRLLDLESRAVTRMPSVGSRVGMPVLSPDGRWLGFTAWQPIRPSVFVKSVDDAGPARLLVEAAGYTVWSQSGDRVYFRSRRGAPSDRQTDGIFELPFDPVRGVATGPAQQLFRLSFSDWLGVPGFDVAADGRFLVVLSDERESMPRPLNVLLDVDDELRRRRASATAEPPG